MRNIANLSVVVVLVGLMLLNGCKQSASTPGSKPPSTPKSVPSTTTRPVPTPSVTTTLKPDDKSVPASSSVFPSTAGIERFNSLVGLPDRLKELDAWAFEPNGSADWLTAGKSSDL